MRIKNIKIRGFKSIDEEVYIDFDDLRGLIKVTGDVGAGKTSIGEAIIFGLYGQIKGKTNADIVNLRTNECEVSIELISRNRNIVINRILKRSKSGSVSNSDFVAYCDGEEIKFSSKKEAQQILESYYDTNRLSIETLCIISFNNFKSIINMKKSEKDDFLDEIFGFNIISEYEDITKLLSKEDNKELNDLNNQISKNNVIIDTINNNPPLKPNDVENIDIEYLTSLYNKYKIEKECVESQRSVDTEPIKNSIKDLNDRLSSIKSEMIEYETLGKSLKRDIDIYKTGFCPTCGQSAPQEKLNELNNKLLDIREKYITTKKLFDGVTTECNGWQSELNKVYDSFSSDIKKAEEEMNNIKNKVIVYKKLKSEHDNSMIAYENYIKEKDQKIINAQNEIDNLNKKLLTIEKEINIYKEISVILSKVKRKILKSFIPTINKNINNFTSILEIPFKIEFDDNFEVFIFNKVYNKLVSTSSLSTGQMKTIDTCIILGVLDALLNKINFNITFFDELMSNMDENLRDNVCKLLRGNIKDSQSIFIINHSPLKDEYFNHSIEVVNKLGSKYFIK